MSDNTVILKTFLYRHEAAPVQELLESAGIHSVLQADDASGWAPHVGIAEGGVALLVPESKLAEARELIGESGK